MRFVIANQATRESKLCYGVLNVAAWIYFARCNATIYSGRWTWDCGNSGFLTAAMRLSWFGRGMRPIAGRPTTRMQSSKELPAPRYFSRQSGKCFLRTRLQCQSGREIKSMPLKLSVGLCRKRSLQNHSGVSASCQLVVELPSEMLSGTGPSLQRQAEIAFDACRTAVHSELSRYEAKSVAASRKRGSPVIWKSKVKRMLSG